MKNLFNIKDKVVVITGGTGVLGKAIAFHLAEEGAKVVILGRKAEIGLSQNSIRWFAPHGKDWHAGTTLHASMPTRFPTSPLPVEVLLIHFYFFICIN